MYSDQFGVFLFKDVFVKIGKLTKNKEFDRVFKEGRSSYDKLLGIKRVENELQEARLGIIVSGKVSKKAVERNRIRRRIREIFRLTLDKIQPSDYIVITLPEIKDKKFQEIEKSIKFNLKRLDSLK